MAGDGSHLRESSILVLILISDDRVPSICKELRQGVLFLFINENIRSSPAFE